MCSQWCLIEWNHIICSICKNEGGTFESYIFCANRFLYVSQKKSIEPNFWGQQKLAIFYLAHFPLRWITKHVKRNESVPLKYSKCAIIWQQHIARPCIMNTSYYKETTRLKVLPVFLFTSESPYCLLFHDRSLFSRSFQHRES